MGLAFQDTMEAHRVVAVASEADTVTKIAGDQKTARSIDTRYRSVRHGYWSRRSWAGASYITLRQTRASGSSQRML